MYEGEIDLGKMNLDNIGVAQKKRYIKPAIIHEFELEVHAGSPIPSDPMDLLSI